MESKKFLALLFSGILVFSPSLTYAKLSTNFTASQNVKGSNKEIGCIDRMVQATKLLALANDKAKGGTNTVSGTGIEFGELKIASPYLDEGIVNGQRMYAMTDDVTMSIKELSSVSLLNSVTISEFSKLLRQELNTIKDNPYEVYDFDISSQPAIAIYGKTNGINVLLAITASPSGRYYSITTFFKSASSYKKAVGILGTLSFNNISGATDVSALKAASNHNSQTRTDKPIYEVVEGEYGSKYCKVGNMKFKLPSSFSIVQSSNPKTSLHLSAEDGTFSMEYSQMSLGSTPTGVFIQNLKDDLQSQCKESKLPYEVRPITEVFGTQKYTDYRFDYLNPDGVVDIEQHVFINSGKAHIFTWKGNSTLADNAKYYIDFLSSLVTMQFE